MKFNRRDFLTLGGSATVGLLFQSASQLSQKIAEGVISNAYAEQTGAKRILSLFAGGAVPNWMFNLCLYPDGENIPSNVRIEGVGTGFDSTGKTVFVQQKRGDYWFPRLWFIPIPTTSGNWVSPAALLDNMLTIRGIWNATDGHQIGSRTAFHPLGANYSIHGMVADAHSGNYPIPGIVAGNSLIAKEFSSPKGINPISAGNQQGSLKTISDSFKSQINLFRGNALDALVTDALNKMDSKSEFKKSSASFNRKKAEELIRSNLASLLTDFATKRTKYLNLIKLACKYDPTDVNTKLPDLMDLSLDNYASIYWQPDDPGVNTINRYFQTGRDLRDLFLTPAELSDVADSFALAEVLFENNLNPNVISNLSGITTISDIVLRKDNNLTYANNRVGWAYDHGHFMGLSLQTLVWSIYFRGFMTCLYEFTSFLQSKNMYNDTVITLNTDFGRSPFSGNATSSRSDHGWQANSTSMWSGSIKTPMVIGNTLLDAKSITGNNYKNLWGVGRKSEMINNYISVGNANSTLATLLGVPSNLPNSKSFIKLEGNNYVPLELPKTA